MQTEALRRAEPEARREPVFVYGSALTGNYHEGAARTAARFHAADEALESGPSGNAYAIPFRDGAGATLSQRTLSGHIAEFAKYAKARPELRFRVARFGCANGEYKDADMAQLFRTLPENCGLPAVWQRHLTAGDVARVLIYDPLIRLQNEGWRTELGRYLKLNMPLWGVSKCELLSVATARRISAVAAAAKALGFPHRQIQADPAYYRDNAEVASEMLAVWNATHFVNISDVNQTVLPSHVRLLTCATREGLAVEDLSPDGLG